MKEGRTEERPADQDWQQDELHGQQQEQQQAEQEQEEHIQERTAPAGEIVYHAVYREGQHELERTTRALLFSGLAAGLSMGFSLLTEAFLTAHLPDTQWRPLVAKLGYSVGFLIVILGRQQLFTENTLTVILPLLKEKRLRILANVGRLWATVLVANIVGALAFAVFIAKTIVLQPDMASKIHEIAQGDMHPSFLSAMLNAIFAGWLIALMIWLLPFAESAKIWVIVLLSYIIGIGHFPHIIAASVPTMYLMLTDSLSVGDWMRLFFAPTLVGNIIGGMAVVALGVHAEFVHEPPKS